MTTLADAIRANRKAQKKSQRDLAEKAGVASSTVSRFEGGQMNAVAPGFVAIADALGLEVALVPKRYPRRAG